MQVTCKVACTVCTCTARRKYAHLLRWCAEAAMQQVELCGALGVLLLLA